MPSTSLRPGQRGRLAALFGRPRLAAVLIMLLTLATVGVLAASNSNRAFAGPQTLTFTADADTKVDSSAPDTNYGNLTKVYVDSSPEINSYVRFNVTGIPAGSTITSVSLKLYATSTQGTGWDTYTTTDNAGWTESGTGSITWNTGKPTMGTLLGSSGSIGTANQYYSAPLGASAVSGNGSVTFGLKTTSATQLALASKEFDTNPTDPTLEIVVNTPTTNTTSFTATGDAEVQATSPTANFGTSTRLHADTSDPSGNPIESYVRFDLSGLTGKFSSAMLKLEPTSTNSVGTLDVWATDNATWAESGTGSINWNNRPAFTGASKIGSTTTIGTANQYYTVDVSSAITALSGNQGVITFGIRSSNATNVAIASKESVTPAAAPVLEVTTVTDIAPDVVASAATNVGENSATLNAKINPENAATTYYFQYGLTTSYGKTTPVQSLTSGVSYEDVSASFNLAFFPGTGYHYRLVASNSAGTTFGPDQTFTTATATAKKVAAAGDIACDPANSGYNGGNGTATTCKQKAVSDLIYGDIANIDKVLTLGDNQYECGSQLAYDTVYDATWGRFKAKTMPAIGNHEYVTSANVEGDGTTGCKGLLQAPISATDTTITLGTDDPKMFPANNGFTLQIDSEKMTVTAGAGTTTFTVMRGVQSTVAASHDLGANIMNIDGTGGVGHYSYFGDLASQQQTGCRDHCKGYYSYNLGNWHLVVLNSSPSAKDGSTSIGTRAGSPQYQWLQTDLTGVPASMGILAYWHHPRFSSGDHGDANGVGGSTYPESANYGFGQTNDMRDMWDLLYQNHADLVLAGHDHNYERFDQLTGRATNELPSGPSNTAPVVPTISAVSQGATTVTVSATPSGLTTPFYAFVNSSSSTSCTWTGTSKTCEVVKVTAVDSGTNIWTLDTSTPISSTLGYPASSQIHPMEQPQVDTSGNGLREIIVGTGGRNIRTATSNSYDVNGVRGTTTGKVGSQKLDNGSGNFGYLELVLGTTGYTWEFKGVSGSTLTDSGTTNIHN